MCAKEHKRPAASYFFQVAVTRLSSRSLPPPHHSRLQPCRASILPRNGGVAVCLGNGNGTRQPAVLSDTGVQHCGLIFGDFNLDDKMDLPRRTPAASVFCSGIATAHSSRQLRLSFPMVVRRSWWET